MDDTESEFVESIITGAEMATGYPYCSKLIEHIRVGQQCFGL